MDVQAAGRGKPAQETEKEQLVRPEETPWDGFHSDMGGGKFQIRVM